MNAATAGSAQDGIGAAREAGGGDAAAWEVATAAAAVRNRERLRPALLILVGLTGPIFLTR
jgi:hypothetical protein